MHSYKAKPFPVATVPVAETDRDIVYNIPYDQESRVFDNRSDGYRFFICDELTKQ